MCVCIIFRVFFLFREAQSWSHFLVLNHDQLLNAVGFNEYQQKEHLKWNDHHHVLVDWNGLYETVVLAKGIQNRQARNHYTFLLSSSLYFAYKNS